LIAGAIGESGSLLSTLAPVSLKEAEESGARFANDLGAKSLAERRELSADELLKAKSGAGLGKFKITIDRYFLPKTAREPFAAGGQAHVPLLVGWNSEEAGYQGILKQLKPTRDNYVAAVKKLYGDRTDEVLKLYPAATDDEVEQAATDLAGDRFIGYGTWK